MVCGIRATSKAPWLDRGDGQADTIDGDRALLDHVTEALRWCGNLHERPFSFGRPRSDLTRGVDMALDDMAVEPAVGPQGPLQVDSIALARPEPRLDRRRVSATTSARDRCRRPTSTAVRQTPLTARESPTSRPIARSPTSSTRRRPPLTSSHPFDRAEGFDDPGEHGLTVSPG